MNILVVGGAGYIGSVVTRQLVEAGHAVFVMDNLSKGYRQAVDEQAVFLHGDLAQPAEIDRALAAARPEAVFHFAALIEAGESMRHPERFFRANVAYTNNLLEACAARGLKKFIFSSTAAVFAASDQPLTETSTIQPANCYGETKWMVEKMLAWYAAIHGLRYAVLRYFNACGAYKGLGEAHLPETHLIPLTLQAALGLRPAVAVYGTDYPTPDGTCIRDYIHVADLADAHLRALDYLAGHATLTCNLGNGQGYSVRDIIDATGRVAGRPIPVQQAARRPGDAPRLIASSALARRELGWQPRIADLGDIIATAWDWIQAHPRGYAG